MREMFVKHCHKWVQMDSTHNVSRYDLKLVVVLVGDDSDYGVPGAFLLTRFEDSTTALTPFLQTLRKRQGTAFCMPQPVGPRTLHGQ
ncbi:MAG: transposase [Gammaproteobacteria bacterium]|nr:transposase [Gammaproteobacteria bacterium]